MGYGHLAQVSTYPIIRNNFLDQDFATFFGSAEVFGSGGQGEGAVHGRVLLM